MAFSKIFQSLRSTFGSKISQNAEILSHIGIIIAVVVVLLLVII